MANGQQTLDRIQQWEQSLRSLVQPAPEMLDLLRLGESLARSFEARLLASMEDPSALPIPRTAAGRQFQLQMMQQLLQQDPDRFAQAALAQFQRMFPRDPAGRPTITQATRAQLLPFATQLGIALSDPNLPQTILPQAWGRPTFEGTLQSIQAMNQLLFPFGGMLGPSGVMLDPGAVERAGLLGVWLQRAIDFLTDLLERYLSQNGRQQ